LSEEESNEKDATPEIVNDVLKKFKMWLQSADGGQLDAKTSEQHHKQMVKLLSVIDEGMEVASLFVSGRLRQSEVSPQDYTILPDEPTPLLFFFLSHRIMREYTK